MKETIEQHLSEWAKAAFCNLDEEITPFSDRINVVKTQDKQFGDTLYA